MVTEHYLLLGILAAGATLVMMGLRDRRDIKKIQKRTRDAVERTEATVERERLIGLKVTYIEASVNAMRSRIQQGDSLLYSLSWGDDDRTRNWRFIASDDFATHVNKSRKHMDIAPSDYRNFTDQCRQRIDEINNKLIVNHFEQEVASTCL
jgi:hypothetical protein